jgi:hypothetical protein
METLLLGLRPANLGGCWSKTLSVEVIRLKF